MIERKDIQGTIVFIDHDNGEIHFSDRSNIIKLPSVDGQLYGLDDLFSESTFETFIVPSSMAGEGCADERITVKEPEPEQSPKYVADETFYNSIDTSVVRNFMGNRFESYKPMDKAAGYDEVLASENDRMIAENIVNTTYADVLLYITSKKLIDKGQILENIECGEDILDNLLTHGLLKENYKGELYFTFKGLVVRRNLESACSIENVQIPAQPIMA
ncbi:MAG: hypothetical protein MIO93_01210 [ANME-2 cluster archaeon]|jgi:hypothetical protein|nr:hypothetical protein [ANME-2 cluster archaeon]